MSWHHPHYHSFGRQTWADQCLLTLCYNHNNPKLQCLPPVELESRPGVIVIVIVIVIVTITFFNVIVIVIVNLILKVIVIVTKVIVIPLLLYYYILSHTIILSSLITAPSNLTVT